MLFGIDPKKIAAVGGLDSNRNSILARFDQNSLNSEERLFFKLCESSLLSTGYFEAGKAIMRRGQPVRFAHVVTSGEVQVNTGSAVFTLGPGAVLGLAEGLASAPSSWDVTALTFINTRIIPIDRALKQVQSANAGLRGICRITVKRVLGMAQAPEGI